MNDIESDIIIEIKEKIKINPKYIHPCNKEFQEDIRKHKFENGYKFISWMQNNGILKNPYDIKKDEMRHAINKTNCKDRKEYRQMLAKRKGYKNDAEYQKEYLWNKGIHSPISECVDYSSNFGIYIGENLFKRYIEENIFEECHNSGKGSRDGGIDFICKDFRQKFIDKYQLFRLEKNREYKIQLSNRCLISRNNCQYWNFSHICYNYNPDYFILCGWLDREHSLHIWMFPKNSIIRGREFWKRESFTITYKLEAEFCRYELDESATLIELFKELEA